MVLRVDAMKRLLLGNLVVCAMLVGLIWTVQVVVYPQFGRVEAEWAGYHAAHRLQITWVVGPLMTAEACLAAALFLKAPPEKAGAAWLSAALVAFVWAWTGLVSVPLHDKLGGGWDAALVAALVRTNWARTLAWSARMLLLGWWTGST